MPRKNRSLDVWTALAKRHWRGTKPKREIFPKEKSRRVERRAKSKTGVGWD
jgi:hypothetical protein